MGSIFGGFWPRFWLDFRFEVGAPCKDVKNAKIAVSPRRESNFQGSGALKNDEKMLENRLSKRSLPQERLDEPLGVDVGHMLGPCWGRKSLEKRFQTHVEISTDFEVILNDFEVPWGGQRQYAWPRGRGFRGVYLR